MSDDDRDIDIESDEGDDSDSRSMQQSTPGGYFSQSYGGDNMLDNWEDESSMAQFDTRFSTMAEKRAHHNALERKRRDHIKDSFTSLRDSVPSLQGEKVASRAQILKKAAEYIQFMRRKNTSHQQDIDDLKRQNNKLETQIKTLEKAKVTGNYNLEEVLKSIKAEASSHESDSSDGEGPTRRVKKLKIHGITVNG